MKLWRPILHSLHWVYGVTYHKITIFFRDKKKQHRESDNDMGTEGAVLLNRVMKSNSVLKSLNLSGKTKNNDEGNSVVYMKTDSFLGWQIIMKKMTV